MRQVWIGIFAVLMLTLGFQNCAPNPLSSSSSNSTADLAPDPAAKVDFLGQYAFGGITLITDQVEGGLLPQSYQLTSTEISFNQALNQATVEFSTSSNGPITNVFAPPPTTCQVVLSNPEFALLKVALHAITLEDNPNQFVAYDAPVRTLNIWLGGAKNPLHFEFEGIGVIPEHPKVLKHTELYEGFLAALKTNHCPIAQQGSSQ